MQGSDGFRARPDGSYADVLAPADLCNPLVKFELACFASKELNEEVGLHDPVTGHTRPENDLLLPGVRLTLEVHRALGAGKKLPPVVMHEADRQRGGFEHVTSLPVQAVLAPAGGLGLGAPPMGLEPLGQGVVDTTHVLSTDLNETSPPELEHQVGIRRHWVVVLTENQLLLAKHPGLSKIAPVQSHKGPPGHPLDHHVAYLRSKISKVVVSFLSTASEETLGRFEKTIAEVRIIFLPFYPELQ
mmetsp:Transcript_1528/g.3146  ORF Transcript_1528/g.3146 Transcript_1528/m.3146 type:complete len:244 (-) Transcript_1528:682-1413(-)